MALTETCTYAPSPIVNGQIVRGEECGKPSTHIEYGDQGRYEYPTCTTHCTCRSGISKGPEDP